MNPMAPTTSRNLQENSSNYSTAKDESDSSDEDEQSEEVKEYNDLLRREIELKEELEKLKGKVAKANSSDEIMKLLHDYNDIKDATQIILGCIARLNGVTVTSLHEEYNLPLND